MPKYKLDNPISKKIQDVRLGGLLTLKGDSIYVRISLDGINSSQLAFESHKFCYIQDINTMDVHRVLINTEVYLCEFSQTGVKYKYE